MTYPPLPDDALTVFVAVGMLAVRNRVNAGLLAEGVYACPRCRGLGQDPESPRHVCQLCRGADRIVFCHWSRTADPTLERGRASGPPVYLCGDNAGRMRWTMGRDRNWDIETWDGEGGAIGDVVELARWRLEREPEWDLPSDEELGE